MLLESGRKRAGKWQITVRLSFLEDMNPDAGRCHLGSTIRFGHVWNWEGFLLRIQKVVELENRKKVTQLKYQTALIS